MLDWWLEEAGCDIQCAEEDVDVVIAEVAINCTKLKDSVVIDDDTDCITTSRPHEIKTSKALIRI